jgi:signal recognition particle receptor subunit beta
MVFFNHATRQMTAKIVYYGPGLCGKTTNLNTIYGKTSQKARGEMVSLNTETDRTLFFDLLPMDVGMVGGFKTKLQLYTVPGQVFYNSTRKLVLKGVDGIVFVVDSQTPMLDACKESYQNLEENLRELGLNLGDIPMVFQWNKRDLKNVVAIEELEAVFNPRGVPTFQCVASDGTGVFETLRGITKLALTHIKTHVLGERLGAEIAAAPVPPPRPVVEALTLSDLPSVTDLFEMEGSSAPVVAAGSVPLPDDDELDLFIEAPLLPEPPEAGDEDIAFLMDGDDAAPHAFEPEVAERPARESGESQPETEPEPILAVIEAEAGPVLVDALVLAVPTALPVHPPTKTIAKVDPLAALSSFIGEANRHTSRPKSVDHREAINSLMGELTQAGRSGAPSVLRLEVPSEVDGQELEVVVQLRHQGRVLVEGQLHRHAPVKGTTARLSVEMKRG